MDELGVSLRRVRVRRSVAEKRRIVEQTLEPGLVSVLVSGEQPESDAPLSDSPRPREESPATIRRGIS
jgi:hypothetical protein